MPDLNAIWTVSSLAQGSYKANYKYGIFGDSTINHIVYKKVYVCNDYHFNLANSNLISLIRQNNKIVYKYYAGSDVVLYDFNINVGDTAKVLSTSMNYYKKKKVLAVSYVQVNGQSRKKWSFQDEYWIEGVGSSIDLLDPLWYGFDLCRSTLCMSHDSVIVYQNQNPDCYTPLPYDCEGILNPVFVPEIKSENQEALLFPNPFSNSATLKTYIELEDAALRVYDILGKEVLTNTNLKGKEIKINRGNLVQGNYYYKLTEKNILISTGKIFIE